MIGDLDTAGAETVAKAIKKDGGYVKLFQWLSVLKWGVTRADLIATERLPLSGVTS